MDKCYDMWITSIKLLSQNSSVCIRAHHCQRYQASRSHQLGQEVFSERSAHCTARGPTAILTTTSPNSSLRDSVHSCGFTVQCCWLRPGTGLCSNPHPLCSSARMSPPGLGSWKPLQCHVLTAVPECRSLVRRLDTQRLSARAMGLSKCYFPTVQKRITLTVS